MIPDILSWIQCFGTYACVLASQCLEKLTQLLAYQTTVVREARRCSGTGWQGYDTMFRQHAANTDKETDWSQLNNSLYAVTFLPQQNGRGKTCELCLETDHVAADCALQNQRNRSKLPAKFPTKGHLDWGWGCLAFTGQKIIVTSNHGVTMEPSEAGTHQRTNGESVLLLE